MVDSAPPPGGREVRQGKEMGLLCQVHWMIISANGLLFHIICVFARTRDPETRNTFQALGVPPQPFFT